MGPAFLIVIFFIAVFVLVAVVLVSSIFFMGAPPRRIVG
jgi:hypothetical protein